MNPVSGNKTLIVIIAILLLTNIGLLIFYLRACNHNREQPKRIGFTERLKKEVGFTPGQMEVFAPKKKAFWDNMRNRFDSIKKTKEDFYYQMYNPSIPDSVIIKKAEGIGEQQKELDLFVIRHFKDIRTLCTPEQLPKYDSLLPAIIKRMTDRPERK
jgi:periplasmic protein CpxP/Spy